MTFKGDGVIPDELAKRLAGEYAQSATGALACFYWTGQVMYASWEIYNEVMESVPAKDDHAVAADARALLYYFKVHQGTPPQSKWSKVKAYGPVAEQIIPWSYRSITTQINRS